MKNIYSIILLSMLCLVYSCSREKPGFKVAESYIKLDDPGEPGFHRDSLKIITRPGGVLLTGVKEIRLSPIYLVNLNRDSSSSSMGSNSFHYRYDENAIGSGNNWNNNLMPGLEAVYGFNMVNISHYNISENRQKNLFSKPVLVRTLYYPSFSKDTLNFLPVQRNYMMVSVYNDDTNKDGFINLKDLRRFYYFDINGGQQKALVPENYSVVRSEYDSGNDYMYVFARLDNNNNGERDEAEPTHIFWIDLKDPGNTGRVY